MMIAVTVQVVIALMETNDYDGEDAVMMVW